MRAQVFRGGDAGRSWTWAVRDVPDRLQPYVRHLTGYTEATPGPWLRREFPGPQVVVIFEFGPSIRVFEVNSTEDAARHLGGFVAGVHDGFALTEHGGFQDGLQLNLTPIGARRVFGLPLSELTNQVVALRELLPKTHRNLAEELSELGDWDQRFDRVERFVEDALARHELCTEVVGWAMRRIMQDGGRTDIRALCRKLGYSSKHVVRLFRDQVGVPPKLLARIVRFDRLSERLRDERVPTWTALAAELGYYDQAHLVRDVRQFTGLAPTAARVHFADFVD